MKVLIATGLYPPEIGGPATYSALLESGLPQRGIEPVVVPFARVRKYPKIIRHVVYGWLLYRSVRGVSSIIALDPVSVGIPARIVAFLTRTPFVIKVVGDYAWEQASQRFGYTGTLESFQEASVPFVPRMLRTLEHVVTRTAHRVIVPSRYLASIVTSWGVDPKRIQVIYNGVSIGDVGTRETIRGMLHFEGELILSVGRLAPWKGFDVLIKVFARLRKKRKALKLFIAGSGPDLARLETVAERERVAEHVIFAGAVDHGALMRYIRAADVFVLNTSYEGFSHLLIETMAVGTPIVTTHVGGNPEAITNNQNGFLVAPNDMMALESRITRLLDDHVLTERIVSAARTKVAEFTDERTLDETAQLFKSLT
jgi:glycosyltransferase involved in cell wall biosynthesis